MDLNRRLLSLLTAFLIILTGGAVSSATTDSVEIRIRAGDVFAYRGQQNISVPIWLDNYQDTVAGFSIWFMMERPDLAEFPIDSVLAFDTSYWRCDLFEGPDCVDSTEVFDPDSADFIYVSIHWVERGNIDTTGTLVAGWEYISATSISGFGTDLNIVGLADMPGGEITPGIPPQQNGPPLIRLYAEAFDDTGTVGIFIFHPDFAAPNGSLIGYRMQEVAYTAYWLCMQWSGDSCLVWQQVSGPPFDSTSTEFDSVMVLDTNVVEIINGSITIVDAICGDMNGSGSVDVADLTFHVDYLFAGGPPPPNLWTADCDGSGAIDVSDLTCFVCYLFRGCPPPACDIWF